MGAGRYELVVSDDAAATAAEAVAEAVDTALRRRGEAALALSGGSTAPPMISRLVAYDLAWDRIGVWQVDERVAPDGDPARNLEQLAAVPGRVHPMDVTAADLDAAAAHYAAGLPVDGFDVIHLGIGGDGHTASWPPDQPSVATSSRAVEVTAGFNGYRRMTLTGGVVNSARRRVVLVVGGDKAAAVERLLAGDRGVPAALLVPEHTTVVADPAAARAAPD